MDVPAATSRTSFAQVLLHEVVTILSLASNRASERLRLHVDDAHLLGYVAKNAAPSSKGASFRLKKRIWQRCQMRIWQRCQIIQSRGSGGGLAPSTVRPRA